MNFRVVVSSHGCSTTATGLLITENMTSICKLSQVSKPIILVIPLLYSAADRRVGRCVRVAARQGHRCDPVIFITSREANRTV